MRPEDHKRLHEKEFMNKTSLPRYMKIMIVYGMFSMISGFFGCIQESLDSSGKTAAILAMVGGLLMLLCVYFSRFSNRMYDETALTLGILLSIILSVIFCLIAARGWINYFRESIKLISALHLSILSITSIVALILLSMRETSKQ